MDQWITGFLESSGYLGVVLLMIAENVFPPIPSELVMPFAGFVAGKGELSLPLVIAAGTLGSVLGALPWYWAGRAIGEERLERWAGRHGRWLTLSASDVRKADDAFDRHAGKTVLFGRLVPAIRTLVSVPAGVSGMPIGRFLLFSTIGSLAWTSVLAGLGYGLGENYERIRSWLGPVTNVIVGLLVVVYLWRVVRWKPEARQPESEGKRRTA